MNENDPAGWGTGWLIADEVVLYAGLSVMLAAIASCTWMRARNSAWALATRAQAASLLMAATGVTLLAVLVQLALQAAWMRDPSSARSFRASLVSMAMDTHVGHAACVGMLALVVVAAVSASGRFAAGGRIAIAAAAVGAAVFAGARSVVSHAGAAGDVSVAVGVLWLHLLLVCGWLGSVSVGAFAAFALPTRSPADRADAQAWLAALSATAGWLLLGIVLTGSFNVWRTGSASASAPLFGSTYAGVLVVKLGWVLFAAGLGAVNRFVRLPALLRTVDAGDLDAGSVVARWRGVIAVLRLEALVLLLALVASAVLGNTEPP